ncbi:hypothetical protein DSO57_1007937 [Entomophthora muscae]|uniref:Uncharacterized protein n=1 Tax=Entomophthora muscae TaxID=34485 RepID=A0ACC2U5R6_9FUNG|nr:hypothetical protein DSO57_1007937 [Entomophthora muscae]
MTTPSRRSLATIQDTLGYWRTGTPQPPTKKKNPIKYQPENLFLHTHLVGPYFNFCQAPSCPIHKCSELQDLVNTKGSKEAKHGSTWFAAMALVRK